MASIDYGEGNQRARVRGALRCAGEESQKSLRAAEAHLGRERKLGLEFCCHPHFYLKIVPL